MVFLKIVLSVFAVSIVPIVSSKSDFRSFLPHGVHPYAQQIDDSERMALATALSNLEHYMFAGSDRDIERGAELLISYVSDEEQAIADTKVFYREQAKLLREYVSLSSDLYGYEFKRTPFGDGLYLEGRVETLNGLTAEYSARMVFKLERWWIGSLQID